MVLKNVFAIKVQLKKIGSVQLANKIRYTIVHIRLVIAILDFIKIKMVIVFHVPLKLIMTQRQTNVSAYSITLEWGKNVLDAHILTKEQAAKQLNTVMILFIYEIQIILCNIIDKV